MDWFKKFFQKPNLNLEFVCGECGEVHNDLSFSFKYPDYIAGWEDEQVESRVHFNNKDKPDLIVVDNEHFFVRCVLEVPIKNTSETIMYGVWQTQSQENFLDYQKGFSKKGVEGKETFSWHSSSIPGYKTYDDEGNIRNVASSLIWRDPPLRPLVKITDQEHPLYHDQKNGISKSRAFELVQLIMHPK